MTTILQITDTHIVPKGKLVSGRLETTDALRKLVTRITSVRQQLGIIDAVLVTGDLSDDGSAESYEIFKELIAPLALQMLVIPGNHDAREPMRAAFPESMPKDGPLNWYKSIGGLKIIGLDTLVEGSGFGALSAVSLEFLQDQLRQTAGSPILLALHHPPFASGIKFMDDIGLTNRDAFRDVVIAYQGTIRIVCGHIHSMMISDIGGHVAISAPSPCSTFAFDRRPEAPIGFMDKEDGCILHRWNDGFQSVKIGADAGSGPFPF